jgi:hypothetical protein
MEGSTNEPTAAFRGCRSEAAWMSVMTATRSLMAIER